MNHDDIERIASDAGIVVIGEGIVVTGEAVVKLCELVAAAEREACAKVCDAEVIKLGQSREALVAGICAASIRARENK